MEIFESFLKERFGKDIKRDPSFINSVTKAVDNGGGESIVTTKELFIYFPERFLNAGLGSITNVYKVIGLLALVVDGHYAVLSIPAMLSMNPISARTIKINDVDYYELGFNAGSVVFETTQILKDTNVVYFMYNEVLAKSNMPFYFNYTDALLVLQKTGKYAGLSLERNNIATEIVVATTTRNRADPNEQFRHALEHDPKANPEFFGLRNVQLGVSNLPSAIMGSYSDIGIDSMLTNPSKRLEPYEKNLRS